MNLLRHAVAPFARDGRFFAAVTKSGAHLALLRALVVDKSADVAAIDCVTFAFARAHLPELTDGVRVIGVTASAPALPFIASMRVPERDLDTLAHALDTALARDAGRAQRLRLARLVRRTAADYAPIARLERDAAELGYPYLS